MTYYIIFCLATTILFHIKVAVKAFKLAKTKNANARLVHCKWPTYLCIFIVAAIQAPLILFMLLTDEEAINELIEDVSEAIIK